MTCGMPFQLITFGLAVGYGYLSMYLELFLPLLELFPKRILCHRNDDWYLCTADEVC